MNSREIMHRLDSKSLLMMPTKKLLDEIFFLKKHKNELLQWLDENDEASLMDTLLTISKIEGFHWKIEFIEFLLADRKD